MPNPNTFEIPCISDFVKKYSRNSRLSVDPFARNNPIATFTNDINPNTSAQHHMDAEEFVKMLQKQNVVADLVFFDPPYSPRQISECYQSAGLKVGMKDTQNSNLYSRVRNAILSVICPEAIVLSFGWNSSGMGISRNFEILEILLVCHGGAHNDTICIAEQFVPDKQLEMEV